MPPLRISIPNVVTLVRFLLAIVFFVLLSFYSATDPYDSAFLLRVAFWLFLIAVATDWLDGYLARVLHQVTTFGRVVDPVVDKIIVLGAFIYFAGPHFQAGSPPRSVASVQVWMVLVLLIRELLVSAIRSHAESTGLDFSADWMGKFKMTLQSVTACFVLGQLAWFPEEMYPAMGLLRRVLVWTTVIVTAISAVTYARRGRAFLLSRGAMGVASQPPPPDREPAGRRQSPPAQSRGAGPVSHAGTTGRDA